MKKTLLLLAGFGLAGFGLYRYFKYQVDKAMNYDYKIKNFKIINVEGKDVTVEVQVEFINRSSFQIVVNSYDMQLFFKNIAFLHTTGTTPVTVVPEGSFIFKGQGIINLDDAKQAVLPFISDVAMQRPIDIQVTGFIHVTFLGINYTIEFDKQEINYSMDILKDYGINKGWENLKAKFPGITKIFSFLG